MQLAGLHDRPLPARPGRDAGQRGPAGLHRLGARAPLRRAHRARPSASSAWPSRPSPTTRGRRSATSSASSCRGPAPASSCTDPYVQDDRLVSLDCVLERERHPDPRGAAQAVPRPRTSGARTSSTCGARWATGSSSECASSSPGAAGFINGYLVPELLEAGHEVIGPRRLQQVRPADQVVRRPSALPLRRGRRQGRRPGRASSRPTATRSSRRPR